MLRAMALIVLASLGLAFSHGLSMAAAERVNLINGIGLIDYSRPQKFKVGSWIKYHVTGSSELGESDDYQVTILIAGEERFWGEDCFWVETWTEPKEGIPNAIATLMSYAIFEDSMAVTNMQLYGRKMIREIDPETGKAVQEVTKRNAGSLKGRKSPKDALTIDIDTLGTESITVPRGTFEALKVSMRQGIGSTADVGDSSMRTEVMESRMIYTSPKIPITGIVREDIDNLIKRKTWKIGQSGDALPMFVMEHARGTAEVVDFGDGLTAQLVPPEFRRNLQAAAGKPAAPKRSAPRKKSS